jgi:hypothetical protein
VDWIRLAEDRDGWRAVVKAMKNLRVLAPHSWFAASLAGRSVSQTVCAERRISILRDSPTSQSISHKAG